MSREDLIDTAGARVARIKLNPGEVSPLHFHSRLVEYVVCLSGHIAVHEIDATEKACQLDPGQVHEIAPKMAHCLANGSKEEAEYLLIQRGDYDFVPVEPP